MTISSTPWINNLNSQSTFRLFCLPNAGAGASIYRTWQDLLPSDVTVCPVQLPGRENRRAELPFTQLSLLVMELAHIIRPYLNCPFAFFGHSMGALISFELARQLRRQKAPEPVRLFVSAWEAPQLPDRLNPPLHQLPDTEFVEQLHRLYGTPEAVLQILLPILRADCTMCGTYVYQEEEPLAYPISVFGGLQDDVSYPDLTAWRDQTCNNFTLRLLPGNHFLIKDSQVPLLQAISHDLMSSRTSQK
jgi:surfactin synthase thioesterase subunit